MTLSDTSPERVRSYFSGRTDVTKRVFDVTISLLLLPVALPIISILCLLVCRDGGPVFFQQVRVGRDGRLFHCWKIRTMVVDAEERLREHLRENPDAAAEWVRDQKLLNDPRITTFGHFLRASSLDELPQILNVLRGEMSLVGPRPITKDELVRYRDHEWAYRSVRPGITGLWQVSGRNEVSYEERVQMDVRYAQVRSLWVDVTIIVRTAGAVLGRTGR